MSNAADVKRPMPGEDGLLAPICFFVFILSGFAGLVYEATWSRYLKAILGHEAYAQALVIGIFLGGIAVGAAWAGSRLERLRYPLVLYAVAEAVLALAAIYFHDLFVSVREALDGGLGTSLTVRWIAGALLIAPQSVLLGTTFPLLAAALVRCGDKDKGSGRTISLLYCCNSLGGVLGALAVGLILVEVGGLPGSMYAGGVASAAAALIAWVLHHRYPAAAPEAQRKESTEPTQQSASDPASEISSSLKLLLAVAVGTGFASLVYEIAWIRMLALILGSSTRAFELILATFIFGLAAGGYYVRTKADRGNLIVLLAKVQLLMSMLALAGICFYEQFYGAYAYMLDALPKTEAGYAQLPLVQIVISLLLMAGPTFCAGMTLPLITRIAIRKAGERTLGTVYAWNTVGSIAGIAAAVLLLLPLVGLKLTIVFGALIDLALGLVLLRRCLPSRLPLAAATALTACAATAAVPMFDPLVLTSSPFLGVGVERGKGEVLFYRDGSLQSVAVYSEDNGPDEKTYALLNNGRSDGATSDRPDSPVTDDAYSAILASLGMLNHPDAETAAVVGYGLGITTQTFLKSEKIRKVTTLEIEPAVIEAAEFLPERIRKDIFSDPRAEVIAIDAKSWLSSRSGGERLDAIVSVPSHPWVSGMASLYSVEHFEDMRKALADDGVLVQWMTFYNQSGAGVASVINAVGAVFDHYAVYYFRDNLFIVASMDKRRTDPINPPRWRRLPELTTMLSENFGINSANEIAARRVGGRKMLEPYFASFEIQANSDYFPVLEAESLRMAFLKKNYALGVARFAFPDVFRAVSDSGEVRRLVDDGESVPPGRKRLNMPNALALLPVNEEINLTTIAKLDSEVETIMSSEDCAAIDRVDRAAAFLRVMSVVSSQLPPAELEKFWERMHRDWSGCMTVLQNDEETALVYGFYSSLVNGDYAAVYEKGLQLLPAEVLPDENQLQRILLHTMVAALLVGEDNSVLQLSYAIVPGTPAWVVHAARLLVSHTADDAVRDSRIGDQG